MTTFLEQAEQLKKTYDKKLPPVDSWDPPLSGDMDMRIDSHGQWFYQGDLITRQSLADLFSSILKKEGDEYFLVTPVEKWKIQVDDAPFIVVAVKHHLASSSTKEKFVFTTSNGEEIIAGPDHPIWMEKKANKPEPKPYVMVRKNMPGLIHRNVFYELVNIALKDEKAKTDGVGVWSQGEFFSLEQTS